MRCVVSSLMCLAWIALCVAGRAGEPQIGPAEAPTVVSGIRVLRISGGAVSTQDMTAFPLGKWHHNDHLWWTGASPGAALELALPVQRPGRQQLRVVLTRAADYGVVQFELDDRKVGGQIDLYSGLVAPTVAIPLGIHDLAPGEHKLTVTMVGSNEKAAGQKHLFGIDRILLTTAADAAGEPPADSVSCIEDLYRLERLPRLRPGVRTRMFSSYDRTGGNNDGFGGTYSKLWIEDGNSVLARMEGAGCIQRIWFTHSEYGTPGLLNLKQEHLRVYVDGQAEPALDVPLEDVFSGTLAHFPKPLVGEGQGGYYCYVPIPYRNGCTVLVEGTGVRFYQITYREFPSAEGEASFRMPLSAAEKEALQTAVGVWTKLGDPAAFGLRDAEETIRELDLPPGQTKVVALPAGPRMVRGVFLEAKPEGLRAAVGAKLRICWDQAGAAAVDLPAEFFFGQALDPPPYRSLLVGATDQGWYNVMPMPYGRGATVDLTSDRPLRARLRIVTVPCDQKAGDLGYFHAVYHEELPTEPDRYYQFLRRTGSGHYAGTYLVTSGTTDRKLPLWLEGDDRFTVDGDLVVHGTGSEDYFNCGWYAVEGRLNGPGSQPQHGFPVYRLQGEQNQAVAFRWHVTDPVHYAESLLAEIEHGADNKLPADYRSAAFFYEPSP
ncbi:MAG: DUF2961 domain-containing protein [Pirellulales bacterium]|nr:DUF2961 domain-containing protein [Pirellulales bacterium]